MGNCCGSSAVWAGEDWGSVVRHNRPIDLQEEEDEGLLGLGEPSPAAGGKEVRIRISRKQLEEVLKRANYDAGAGTGGGGQNQKNMLMADEVLDRLMESSECFEVHRHGSWRPALQSIPEVD
ncbi:hypothetical protein Dimus_032947 [Dionaea muscipula]